MSAYYLVFTVFLIAVNTWPLQNATAQNNPDHTFTLNLKNVDINSLIETVSARTGKNFIVDPRVKATVSIVSSKPLNADKLYEMFLSILEVHGYAAVQAGSMTKIVPSSTGIQSAVPVLSDKLNAGDEIVSHIVQLKHIHALEMVEALRPLLPESASISAENTSNTVVITDRAANVEKLIELITVMDGL